MNVNSVLFVYFFTILFSGCSQAQRPVFTAAVLPVSSESSALPLELPEASYPVFKGIHDSYLSENLLQELQANPRWKALIEEKRMAVGVVDLWNPQQMRYAAINGNEMMYAASLPKIAILLATMDALEKREIPDTKTLRQDLRLMISHSDNHASTRCIDRLGYDKIESVLTNEQYKLYDPQAGGGLWVGKRYAHGGPRHPDPIKGLSHAATVTQVCKFYYMLATGGLVSRKRSAEMLDIMEKPDLHHKFVNTLERIAPMARLFRKSGSWQNFHSDSVLVWGPGRRYILVGLVEDAQGEQIIRQLVEPVEAALGVSGTDGVATGGNE